MGKKIDMTGWKMWEHGVPDSNWEIIEEDKNNKHKEAYWFCKCNLCGEIESKNGVLLRKGTAKCGKCNRQPSFIDMTGWVMKEHGVPNSRVTVIKELNKKSSDKRTMWECKCECGKVFEAIGELLRKGTTKSCGCYNRDCIIKRAENKAREKIGKRNGMLVVKEYLGLRYPYEGARNRVSFFLCQCDCGGTIEVSEKRVQDGRIKSCGCISTSIGEKRIQIILENNNIKFEHDKCFSQLIEDTNRNLRFDFTIYNNDNTINRFVEFDGIQHTTGLVGGTWGKIDNKEIIQERDKIKNDWCLKNNYTLIRIPHTKLNTLCLEDIMGDKFIYKGDDS